MPFLVTVKANDLGRVFSSPTISAGSRGRASVFLTLIPLLIQTSMLFLLSPSLLIGGVATFGGQGVGQLWYQRRLGFFDGFVAGVSGGRGL